MKLKRNKEEAIQMARTRAIGIDIASAKFDVCFMDEHEKWPVQTYPNNETGIRLLIDTIRSCGSEPSGRSDPSTHFSGKIVMESTGRYHELVAVMLHTAGFETYVINPLRAKKYHTASVRKLKTDKNDAKILAEMALKERVLDRFDMNADQMRIKKKIYLIRSLEKSLQKLQAIVEAYRASSLTDESSIDPIADQMKIMRKQLEIIQKDIISLVFPMEDTLAQESRRYLMSIPWVSEYYAALVAFFYRQPPGMTLKSWIAYTGLEVSVQESGTWHGKGRLSKRGNKYLRKRNYSAAWWAIMNYEYFRAYYDELKARDRSHVEATTIIGRKILRIAYSCLKNKRVFDPEKFGLSQILTT